MLKDYWGNDALDFGDFMELTNKYRDKVFVTVSNKPFGNSYVLFVCNEDEYDKAEEFFFNFGSAMEAKGIRAYGSGISLGSALLAKRMDGFQGGAEL